LSENLFKLNREIKRVKSTYNGIEKLLNGAIDPIVQELKEMYREDMGLFCEDFWPLAGTTTALIKGYAWDGRVQHFDALLKRQIKFLLWTEPPKEGKSTFFNVLAPVYSWVRDPTEKILSTCYAPRWAYRDNRYMQQLIMSEEFQYIFGSDFHLIRKSRDETTNNRMGQRVASHVDGQITSSGGTILLFDDPNSISDKRSPDQMQKPADLWDSTFIHRMINPARTVFFIGQHRVGANDLYGHVERINYPGMVCVHMPFSYVPSKKCVTYLPGSNKIFWQDPRTEEGEYINPIRHTPKDHEDVKRTMLDADYAALYQCEPYPTVGGIFRREWFKVWNSPRLPDFEFIVSSWDTAISTASNASYSACTIYGVFKNDKGMHSVMFLNSWHGRLEWTELRKMAVRLGKNIFDSDYDRPHGGSYESDFIVVEAKANGPCLADELRLAGLNAINYNPPKTGSKQYGKSESGKIIRARLRSAFVEAGRVYVKGRFPYEGQLDFVAEKFIEICLMFPNGPTESRDIMDTFSMALDFLSKRKMLLTKEEEHEITGQHQMIELSKSFRANDASNQMIQDIPTYM
jgi:phage terminase large subunit-like protein